MNDWIVDHIPDTTFIPAGEDIAYIRITTEVLDNKATKYEKVDYITLKRKEEIESEAQPSTKDVTFKKFSESTKQKQRKHSNKRQKFDKNIK